MKIDKIQINGTVYGINGPATEEEYGLIKLGYTENNQNYPVRLSDGKAYVYVPWTNTTYTLGGLMGASAKGSGTQPIYWDGSLFASTTYSLNKTVPSNAIFTDTTYSIANAGTAGLIKAIPHANTVSYNDPSTVEGKYYSVEVDSYGKAFVNVPWVAAQSENGAITEIQMNGSSVTNTNGVVDLGSIVTEDSVVVYEVVVDQPSADPVTYKLNNNKTFSNVLSDFTNNKQINVKYTYLPGNTRVYTLQYISNNGALFCNIDAQTIGDPTIYYIYTDSLSNGQVTLGQKTIENGIDGSDGEDGVGIDMISITYATSSSGTTVPSSWNNAIPTVTPGDYLWTKIEISYTDNTRQSTIAYSVARLGGGSSQMSISSADQLVQNNVLSASSNILYRFTNPVSALTIQLQQPSSSNAAVEYLFRFKTASSGVNIAFTDYQDQTSDILYPFDYVLNINTEYEISVLYDGSKYLVRNCAYQSNS